MRSYSSKWISVSAVVAIMLGACTDTGVDPETPQQPFIEVTAPGPSGARWYTNAGYSILWKSNEPAGDLVSIDLYKDTVCVQAVARQTPNDGSFTWTLPLQVASGNGYRIKITGSAPDPVWGVSGAITVINNYDGYEPDDNAAHAALIDTAGTIQYHTVSKQDVDWVKFNATKQRSYCVYAHGNAYPALQLYEPDGVTPVTGSGTVSADSNFMSLWTCAGSGAYYCRITSIRSDSLLPYAVTVCASGAILMLVSPGSGSSFYGGTPLSIAWVKSGNTGNHISLYLYRNDTCVDTIGKAIYNSGSCAWTIPYLVPASGRYRIKITPHGDTSIHDYSDFFTIIKPVYSLSVTSPVAGAQWNTGVVNTIEWTGSGSADFAVNIDVYDSTAYIGNIAAGIKKSSGSYGWRTPSSLYTSTAYRIKISDPADPSVYDYSDSFTIHYIPSSLTITAPSANTTWETGTQNAICWTCAGNVGNFARLDLFDSLSVVMNIAGGVSTPKKDFIWEIPPNLSTGAYRLKITGVEDTTLSDFSDLFAIKKIPATITVTAPCSTDAWDVISTHPVRWSSTGLSGSYCSIELYNDATLELTIASKTPVGDTGFSWSLPSNLAGGGRYRIKITCTADSAVYDYSDPFTIVPIPNRITVTIPVASSQWNTGSTYSIQWTYTLNPGPLVKIELYDSSAPAQTLTSGVSAGNQTFSWTVPSTLDSGDCYRIRVGSTTIDSVFDFSDTFTIVYIPSGITITAPTTGTNWVAGSSQYIYWNSVGNVPGSYVSIHLYDSLTWVDAIAANVNRLNNRYYWNIPSSIAGGSRCRIKIMSTTDTTVHGFSNSFSITEQPKRLTVAIPGSTTLWKAGENNSIYWTYSGSPGQYCKIDLYDSAVYSQTVTASVLTTNGTCLWPVPTTLKSGARYQIKITSTSIDTVFDYSETFTIENPVISDPYEPDSVYTLAKLIVAGGPAQTHALSVGDLDWLKFEAAGQTTYTIATEGSLDTYLNLFGANGATLLDSDDDGGNGLNALLVWVCPAGGTYYFRVHGNFKGRAPLAGYYTVSVR